MHLLWKFDWDISSQMLVNLLRMLIGTAIRPYFAGTKIFGDLDCPSGSGSSLLFDFLNKTQQFL